MTNFMESKNKKINKIKIILILLASSLFFFYVINVAGKKINSTEIKIGQNIIHAQIANTEHKRSMGLAYTEKMDENSGMLFIFDETGEKNFWMRDMYFNIDIIWLDENKQVVGFFENVKKESYNSKNPELSKIYRSPENTKYVLEVNAGMIDKLKIKSSDVLDFKY